MKVAIACAAMVLLALSLVSACVSDALDPDAKLRRDEGQIDQLIDSVLFFKALIAPTPSSQTKSANEVRP